MQYSLTLVAATTVLFSATGISAQNSTTGQSNSTITGPGFGNLLPGCCDKDFPSSSKGVVQSLLIKSANTTGTTTFRGFGVSTTDQSTNNTSGEWKWNFAAVQLNATVANGMPQMNRAQFAAVNWLDAPGLWDDENSKWDQDFELCATQLVFADPTVNKARLGYNSTISNSISQYGGCETAFERDHCAKDLAEQVKKLYASDGCKGLNKIQIDQKCIEHNGVMSKPFLVRKGKAGQEEFQKSFFLSSAGIREGVNFDMNNDTTTKKLLTDAFGAVVNEVRPLVMVKKATIGGATEVKLACVKGETVSRGSLENVIAGPMDDNSGDRVAVGYVMGGVLGLVGAAMMVL
ncbi:hypothetical protein DFH27DRAFT_579560 [Peziza echinospora]|nr:hypothetical protein DFH27DRAFT_579560 [Peziza echinospora]